MWKAFPLVSGRQHQVRGRSGERGRCAGAVGGVWAGIREFPKMQTPGPHRSRTRNSPYTYRHRPTRNVYFRKSWAPFKRPSVKEQPGSFRQGVRGSRGGLSEPRDRLPHTARAGGGPDGIVLELACGAFTRTQGFFAVTTSGRTCMTVNTEVQLGF